MERDKSNNLPWHPGELAVQDREGMREKMAGVGARVIRGYMPDQHREFFTQLPMLIMAASDREGRLWASAVFGKPGFVHSPTPTELHVETEINKLDPLVDSLRAGMNIGLLGIELATRRRNRVNAILHSISQEKFALSVKQSFGNCPKYIQLREYYPNPQYGNIGTEKFAVLSEELSQFIACADTLFIATQFDDGQDLTNRGVDVSHRGGKPGFVKTNKANQLLIPDYEGNHFFNTTGNLTMNSSTGLLFMDFQQGHLVYLHGETEIVWKQDEALPFANVNRMLRFKLQHGRIIYNAMPYLWTLKEVSPFNIPY